MTSKHIEIFRTTLMIFGSKEKARTWLHRKQKMFDDQSAWELMQTVEGSERVRDLLNRLAYAFFA
jgi:putative toxin-antitoxin system antitoxin component (TIGR02293 family)